MKSQYLIVIRTFVIIGLLSAGTCACSSTGQKDSPAGRNGTPGAVDQSIHNNGAQKAVELPPKSEWAKCEKGSDVRILAVNAKGNGCELEYTKFGKSTFPASSTRSLKHCKLTLDKIRAKLAKSGYQCI